MCGVFAAFMKRPLDPGFSAKCARAVMALAHRGPDGEGNWSDAEKGVFLGHRRLAIIDPGASGAQPMHRDGTVISYNGELYNYKDLAGRLKGQGTRLTSASDTEVLLQAWRRWGAEMLDCADGMFAFALWDGQTGYLATDPFGEKPLYVAATPDGVVAASELAALRKVLILEPAMSQRDWAEYFSLGQLAAPHTAFGRPVMRMPPASLWRIAGGELVECRRYWQPPLGEPGKGPVRPFVEAELNRIEAVLSESLERRYAADVPVALFLSAGVDSSLVGALSRRVLDRSPKALTVSFKDDVRLDEAPQAAQVAAALGLEHETLPYRLAPEDSSAEFLLELMGQLNGNTGGLPVYQLARAAVRHGYNVALTGIGGDEVSYGYGKNAFYWRWRRVLALPDRLRAAAAGLGRVPGGKVGRAAMRFGAAKRDMYMANKAGHAFPWLCRFPGFSQWLDETFGPGSLFDQFPVELAVPAYELTRLMPGQQLVSNDHASMRASLETRTPFLSRAVQEAVAALDPRALLAFGQKNLLRRILKRHLPAALVDRPKSGFTMPQGRLLEGILAPPTPPGLDPDWCGGIWARRRTAPGLETLAVRLLVAERFFALERNTRAASTVNSKSERVLHASR